MNSFEDISIDQATATLRCGGVVAFPTDTVYGVGTDPFQPKAVRKLYQIKGRPMDKPIPILVGSVDDVQHVAQDLPPMFNQIAERFWPGGLTLIVKAKTLPSEVTAGGDTVGVRMPDHPIALALLQRFGGAIATTSANRSDEPPATSATEVRSELGELVDIVLDGGATVTRIASTVLDLTVSPPHILRQGGVSMDQLAPVIHHPD